MKKAILHLLFAVGIVLLTIVVMQFLDSKSSQTDVVEQQLIMPEIIPEGTKLYYSYDSGFGGDYEEYYFSSDQLTISILDVPNGATDELAVDLEPAVLEYIYDTMFYYQFDQIDIVDDFAADRGGVTIKLIFEDGVEIEKKATGGDYITPEDQAEFDLISELIEDYIADYYQK